MESRSFPKGNENLSFRDGRLTELSWSNYSWYESLGYIYIYISDISIFQQWKHAVVKLYTL